MLFGNNIAIEVYVDDSVYNSIIIIITLRCTHNSQINMYLLKK